MGKRFLKALAALEVGSAAFSMVQWATELPSLSSLSWSSPGWGRVLVSMALFSGVLVLTLVAGVLLWRARPAGMKLSLLAQLAQVPFFALPTSGYQMVLGYGAMLVVYPASWQVELSGSIGTFESLLAFGHTGATRYGVNLVAAGFVVSLCRTMWRDARAARMPAGQEGATPVAPRPWPLRVARRLVILTAILATPLLALWAYNRIDEAPSPESRRWFAPVVHTAPDAANAWLFMLGIGAAEAEEPVALGRRRLEAYEARIADPKATRASDREQALEADPLPFVSAPGGGNKIDASCDPSQRDCLAWARKLAVDLARLEAANAIRLRRYETLLGMDRFEDLSTPSLDSPVPGVVAEDTLLRALIWRDLADPGRRNIGVKRLQRALDFWQRSIESAGSFGMGQIAERSLERHLRIVAAMLGRLDAGELAAVEGVLAPVLQTTLPSPRRWEPVMRREVVLFDRSLRMFRPGPIDAWRHCVKDCLKFWVMAQFMVPAATRNVNVKLWEAVLAAHVAGLEELPAAERRIAEMVEALEPFPREPADIMRRIWHNYIGRTWVVVSLPSYGDHLYMQHDLEGLRRLLRLKIAALKQRVSRDRMPEFLAQQPAALRNAYTGKPFDWDPAARQIRFEPKSKKWQRQHLMVAMP